MKLSLNIKLGVVGGLIICLIWYFASKSLGFYTTDVFKVRNFSILILILLGVFIAIYAQKKKNNGFLEFKDALKTGVVFCFVLGIIVSVFNYVYFEFISPDTLDYFLSNERKEAIAHNATAEQIKELESFYKAEKRPIRLLPSILFPGLIISLLAGALFQKKDPTKQIV